MEYSIRTPLLNSSETARNREDRRRTGEEISKKTGLIKCASCQLLLAYPEDAICIQCPDCNHVTAVKNLSTMSCGRCQEKMIFPQDSPGVICKCGQAYSLRLFAIS